MNHPNRELHRQRDNPCCHRAKLQGHNLLQPTENHNKIQKNLKSKKPRIASRLASTGHHECLLTQLGSSSSCYHEPHNSRNHPPLKQRCHWFEKRIEEKRKKDDAGTVGVSMRKSMHQQILCTHPNSMASFLQEGVQFRGRDMGGMNVFMLVYLVAVTSLT
ncbi:uncharacterized protein LOC106775176 isoform X1 [Vigna radiata var. radiata]|uniref:Uncharacterized protein LOC106775176 isoform X1 n=1 Tax=Vigna radiata var. radiata TaxID=3916 RepID=A0A3Q0FG08_VIGRR|nr:uncharacterized protein LOC106775176 isoform X1 [Vigna radiata var. radiata]